MYAKRIFLVIAAVMTSLFIAFLTTRIVYDVRFDIDCTQYIERAAKANTVPVANQELSKAIAYAEEHDLTHGIVSICHQQPKNDIGYWYNNLVSVRSELETLSNATPLEQSNGLMKIRKSLGQETENGLRITQPDGISIHPFNTLFLCWGLISFILAIAGWIAFVVAALNY